jgi:glycosyltransferase involved in cell wall biosynthesis
MVCSVLLVGNFLSSSGRNQNICEELALRLAAVGWTVVITSTRPSRYTRPLDMLRTCWHQRHQYTVAQVDVFSGPAFFWAEAVCWVLRRLSKPYIVTLRGGHLPEFTRRWPKRVKHLMHSAAAIAVPSLYLAEQLGFHRSNLYVLPNAVDLKNYKFRLREQAQPHLLWLRAFHNIYNPALAAKVTAVLAADFPDSRLTMIGPDKGDGSMSEFKQLAAELGVTKRIILPGGIPKAEVPHWMNQMDVFLNTTNVDNTPVSVLEALACGLCIVSTNVGGIPYLLEHESDALLVPPDNPEAMADAIRRLLTEPGLARRLSQNARRKAEQFDWSIILPQWEAVLTSVA